MLALGDLAHMAESEIKKHIAELFEIDPKVLKGVEILIAHETNDGYSAANWFLLRKGQKLFENHGGHCSCYGFEGQWEPEQTTKNYLKSDKFSFSDPEERALDKVKNWIKLNL